jgi:phenylalanyl-tRNA synthetase alpha chain
MKGHLHPLTTLMDQVFEYFDQYGFEIVYGREVESEENNFDLLNIPADHPSRDTHDTFYLKNGKLLRTQTSAMQIEEVKKRTVPMRLLFPGRVFRNEATDATHNHTFHQLEGVVIDTSASLADLIGCLDGLMKQLFGEKTEIRVRPSYFPFVEPGIEIDVKRPSGKWLEILGAGMIHPIVLKNMGLDPEKYQGFAFGVGLERLLSLLTHSNDIRLVMSGDYRYLGQY